MNLGTLTDGLGCFPLDYGHYHPQSDCIYFWYSGLIRSVPRDVAVIHQCSTSNGILDASLKLFRENSYLEVRLAFTIHRSSPDFQHQWVRPPFVSPKLQPAHG